MTVMEMLESFNGTEAGTRVAKYDARLADVLRPILDRLRQSDPEAFDVMLWLVWWAEHGEMGKAWREKVIGELNIRIAELEKR